MPLSFHIQEDLSGRVADFCLLPSKTSAKRRQAGGGREDKRSLRCLRPSTSNSSTLLPQSPIPRTPTAAASAWERGARGTAGAATTKPVAGQQACLGMCLGQDPATPAHPAHRYVAALRRWRAFRCYCPVVLPVPTVAQGALYEHWTRYSPLTSAYNIQLTRETLQDAAFLFAPSSLKDIPSAHWSTTNYHAPFASAVTCVGCFSIYLTHTFRGLPDLVDITLCVLPRLYHRCIYHFPPLLF